ncbi:MAG: ABC transporter permease [Candidatus Omnitrophica bacterium]|nr:ABC transporter permease [Candidatus Omnitrophota bacterium]
MVSGIGAFTISCLKETAQVLKLLREILYWIFIAPFKGKPLKIKLIFDQMIFSGWHSTLIVFFVTMFTGIVLAMQAAYQLEKMGALMYVASLVAVSLCRELSPVLTALVVGGRVGSAIAAELGTMKVSEQIEALETMAINPVKFLAVPRFIALFFMLPVLTIFGDAAGIFGGYLMGVHSLKINPALYTQITFKFLLLKDIYTGLAKSFVFAMIIALIGCRQGLNTRGGAEGVGKATTNSVVLSFIFIILADCIITGIFYFSNM